MINPPRVVLRVTLMDGFGLAGLAIFGTVGYGLLADIRVSLSTTAALTAGGFALGCLVGLGKALTREYKVAPVVSHPAAELPRVATTAKVRRLRALAVFAGILTFFVVAAGVLYGVITFALARGVSPDSQMLSLISLVVTIIPGIFLGVLAHDRLARMWGVREEDLDDVGS